MSVESSQPADSAEVNEYIVTDCGSYDGDDASRTEVASDASSSSGSASSGRIETHLSVRAWFEGLSTDRIPAAMAVCDKKFLTKLVGLVSLTTENGLLSTISWEAMVSSADADEALLVQSDGFSGNSMRSEGNVVEPIGTKAEKSPAASTSSRGDEPADDVRIQDDLRSRIPEFMDMLDHLLVVLPDDDDHESPILTIDPKYCESKGAKILSILDSAADTLLEGDFLTGDGSSSLGYEESLPLCALLLERIEQATRESRHHNNIIEHNEEQAREGNTLSGTVSTKSHSDRIQKLMQQLHSEDSVDANVQPFLDWYRQGVLAEGVKSPLELLTQEEAIPGKDTSSTTTTPTSRESDSLASSQASSASSNGDEQNETGETLVASQQASPSRKKKKNRKRNRNKKKEKTQSAPVAAKPTRSVTPPPPPPSPPSPPPPPLVDTEKAAIAEAEASQEAAELEKAETPVASPSRRKKASEDRRRVVTGTAMVASLLYISDDSDEDSSSDNTSQSTNDPITSTNAAATSLRSNTATTETANTTTKTTTTSIDHQPKEDSSANESDDAWETVEVKTRNNRRKANDNNNNNHNSNRGQQHRNNNNNNNRGNSNSQGQDGKKVKGARGMNNNNSGGGRKRNVTKKPSNKATESFDGRNKDSSVVTPRAGGNPWNTASLVKEPAAPTSLRDVVVGKHTSSRAPVRQSPTRSMHATATKTDTKLSPSTADHDTAPTFQDTVSASSNALGRKNSQNKAEGDRATRSEVSSANSDDAPQNQQRATQNKSEKGTPVPTLLSPQTGNSSTSSVASSLEAPHSMHRRHHSSAPTDSNDVGYHLLDVCDRLSRDMGLFMVLRSQALVRRRHERETLLASLQESVAKLWPGQCHVQLYGSCATQLDLPSSDLDVVVAGLGSLPDSSKQPSQGQPPFQRTSVNADRIRLLGAELESQPWAVRVNAIPTASVPVVKVLADPSRLQDAMPNAEWTENREQGSPDASNPNMQHPWRGADVMNGLLSFDITFEGPEHGGIGSTEFSAQVVNEACNEAGVPPDGTPLVQVVMILKELLAQRKLNEPYTGGLSSYAILLLVVALLRERAIIREDIERAERYRRAVSTEARNNAPEAEKEKANKMKTVSSWAAIAKSKSTPALTAVEQTKKTASFADALARSGDATSTTASKEPARSSASSAGENEYSRSSLAAEQPTFVPPVMFQQSYNDVIEVLCSGEPTAGKLLMHFFLHYGEYFDAQTTAIDVSGKHERDMSGRHPFSYLSSFIGRGPASVDPITGMLTVDAIVIYDPLAGAEHNNVARRCFAWNSIRWIFAQSYSTLSSMVERNNTPPVSPGNSPSGTTEPGEEGETSFDLMDPSSPILRSLLSF